jgi:hypothetical protein
LGKASEVDYNSVHVDYVSTYPSIHPSIIFSEEEEVMFTAYLKYNRQGAENFTKFTFHLTVTKKHCFTNE